MDAIQTILQQLMAVLTSPETLATGSALVSGFIVKWWNKKKGTTWHLLLSPVAAVLFGAVTMTAAQVELTPQALAAPGAAAIAIQSIFRGARKKLIPVLVNDSPTVGG